MRNAKRNPLATKHCGRKTGSHRPKGDRRKKLARAPDPNLPRCEYCDGPARRGSTFCLECLSEREML